MIDLSAWLDGLLLATLGGSAVLLAASRIAAGDGLSAHLRHLYLAGALGCCVAMLAVLVALQPAPVGCLTTDCVGRVVGAGEADRSQTFAAAGKFPDLQATPAETPGPAGWTAWRPAALLLWAAGGIVVLTGTARRRWRTARLRREARHIDSSRLTAVCERWRRHLGIADPLLLLQHERVNVPSVGGVLRPMLFLPAGTEDQPAAEVDMILLHELAHVRRRDPLACLLGELATALFWFNPLVWRAVRSAREWREVAADSVVLEAGVRPSRYARCLLRSLHRLAGNGEPLAHAHSLLGTGPLQFRLRAILDPRAIHRSPSPATRLGVALVFGAAALGLPLLPAVAEIGGSGASALTLDRSALDHDSIDALLRPVFIDTMADRYIAGAAISVVHEGKVVYQSAFGRREVYQEEPVDAERTIFRIGSITKVLTGVAVMQLVERGLLDLDADVNRYLTELEVPATYDEPVRVRHLLTHTAGFDQIGLGRHVATAEEVRPLGEFLADGNLIRIRPPEEVSSYDTYAITLAGYLVEEVSGLPYETYLRRHIFEPLRMTRSGISVPANLAADVAVGYEFRGNWFPQDWEYMNTDPASTANATVADMARFAIMLLQEGELDGARILSADSVEAMLTRQYANHPDHPGYGLTFFEDMSYGVPAFSHGGSMNGYGAMLYLVPAFDLGVFLAYTQESGALIDPVLTKLIARLFPQRPPHRELRPRVDPGRDVGRFAGTYANNAYHHSDPSAGWSRRPFDIELEGEALMFQGAEAHRVGRLDFQRDDGLLLSFREDGDGKITHLFVNQAVYERLD